ncbi:hypothetical protein D3C85_1388470 [compost metagenome]
MYQRRGHCQRQGITAATHPLASPLQKQILRYQFCRTRMEAVQNNAHSLDNPVTEFKLGDLLDAGDVLPPLTQRQRLR